MAGRMRWSPTGLVVIIVGTWAHGADDDAMVASATFGGFSCSEVPTPPHRHTAAHPAGLWMGVRVPGLSATTAQNATPVAHCHLIVIAHIDTTLGRWFGVGFDPNGDFLAFNGTAIPAVAQSPDDRAVRISLCASVRKDDETAHFAAFGSVVDGHVPRSTSRTNLAEPAVFGEVNKKRSCVLNLLQKKKQKASAVALAVGARGI